LGRRKIGTDRREKKVAVLKSERGLVDLIVKVLHGG
jgi:hypothetical protein